MKIVIELKFRGKSTDEHKHDYALKLMEDLADTMEGEPDVWELINDIKGSGAIKKYYIEEGE
jgi:hypothetical protein